MTEDQELDTPAGQYAIAAARLVSRMSDSPGTWDFLEEFKPLTVLHDLQSRASENTMAQTSIAAEEGRKLFLYHRGVELANAIQAAKNQIKEREQTTKK